MTYRVNQRSFGFYLLLVLILGLGLWGLLSYSSFYRAGTWVAVVAARPFWRLGAAFGDRWNEGLNFFASRRSLIDDNQTLRLELEPLRLKGLEFERLASENAVWREIFNRRNVDAPDKITVGRLLTRAAQSPSGIVLADVGSETTNWPVEVHDLAVVGGVLALGQVLAVYPETVKIQLFSAAGYRLEVLIGEAHLPAEAIGRGGGNFRLSLPRDLPIKVDDRVTAMINGREYLLGTVGVVNRDPLAAFQEVLFRHPINLTTLSLIEIHGS